MSESPEARNKRALDLLLKYCDYGNGSAVALSDLEIACHLQSAIDHSIKILAGDKYDKLIASQSVTF